MDTPYIAGLIVGGLLIYYGCVMVKEKNKWKE